MPGQRTNDESSPNESASSKEVREVGGRGSGASPALPLVLMILQFALDGGDRK
jgi:hypothetical protein